jgi:hypothetical protein
MVKCFLRGYFPALPADYYGQFGFIVGSQILESVLAKEGWYYDGFARRDKYVWGLGKQYGFFRHLLGKPAYFYRAAFRNVAAVVQAEGDYF